MMLTHLYVKHHRIKFFNQQIIMVDNSDSGKLSDREVNNSKTRLAPGLFLRIDCDKVFYHIDRAT